MTRVGIPGICAALGLALATVPPALAGAPSASCIRPMVFPGGAVNVVILPFSATGKTAGSLGSASQQFTTLMHLETLFSILKYGSVGVIRLVANPAEMQSGECTPEVVLAKLLGERPGAAERMRTGNGLILVSGQFYEEEGNVYVQTYVRFLRAGAPEEFHLSVKDVEFRLRLPATSVALPPQLITKADLEMIGREFERIAVFRSAPKEESTGTPFPLKALGDPKRQWTFSVMETRGEWMLVESFGTGPSGWVHAGGIDNRFLQLKAPKFSFIEGVAGYLRQFVPRDGNAAAPAGTVPSAERALDSFIAQTLRAVGDGRAVDSPALAVAESMRGLLRLLAEPPTAERAEQAQALFVKASGHMPYSADARNLVLVTRLYLTYQERVPKLRADELARDFARATALEPDNSASLANLASLYRLLLAAPPPGADPLGALPDAELSKRLAAVQSVKIR